VAILGAHLTKSKPETMDYPRYQIFEFDQTKKTISYNWMMFGIWAFALIFFWTAEQYFFPSDFYKSFKNTYLVLAVLLSIYFLIVGLWSYQTLKGKLNGFIEFKKDAFEINEETFKLDEIAKLDIHCEDYYGQQTRGIGMNFSPGLSQGVSNFIEFTDYNNLNRKVYFKQTVKSQYKDLSSFIIICVQKGKIPFLRGIELLGITDYNEIQEFKKTATNSGFANFSAKSDMRVQ
jgi:hypothetical protein